MGERKPILTPEIVGDRVDAIAAMADDDEQAHRAADQLWRDVLEAISERRAEDPGLCAFVALKVDELDFSRWCA